MSIDVFFHGQVDSGIELRQTFTLWNNSFMKSDNNKTLIEGRYWCDKERNDVIYVTPVNNDTKSQVMLDNITYNDIHGATHRYFVDRHGFSDETISIQDDSDNHDLEKLVARVQFYDDGIIMAKLQGILN